VGWSSKLGWLPFALITLALSCGGEQKPPLPRQPIGQTTTSSAPLRSAGGSPARPAEVETVPLTVTSRLRTICRMPEAPPIPSDFVFDGQTLRPSAGEDVLHTVATCLTAPAQAQRRLCVSGYIDQRGVRDVEIQLGRAHADATAQYLERLRIAGDRIRTAVRNGELLTGGELSVPATRRVEVDVQDALPCTGEFEGQR
jgi:hypothetical protein